MTFDGWSCWPNTPAGTTAYAQCPNFITGFDASRKFFFYITSFTVQSHFFPRNTVYKGIQLETRKKTYKQKKRNVPKTRIPYFYANFEERREERNVSWMSKCVSIHIFLCTLVDLFKTARSIEMMFLLETRDQWAMNAIIITVVACFLKLLRFRCFLWQKYFLRRVLRLDLLVFEVNGKISGRRCAVFQVSFSVRSLFKHISVFVSIATR